MVFLIIKWFMGKLGDYVFRNKVIVIVLVINNYGVFGGLWYVVFEYGVVIFVGCIW